jgi:hypothetical protein
MNNQKYSLFPISSLSMSFSKLLQQSLLFISWYVLAKEAWVLVKKRKKEEEKKRKKKKKYRAQVFFKVFKVQKREVSAQGAK